MFGRLLGAGAMGFGGAPIWLWVLGALLLANLAQFGVNAVRIAGRDTMIAKAVADLAAEKQDRERERREAVEATLEQARLNAAETLRRLNQQQENQRVQDERRARVAADAALAHAAADGLRLRAEGYLEAAGCGATSGDSALACIRAAASRITDALGQCGAIARQVATFADDARERGLACEADYDALTLKP
jgi:hypothetical protein